MIRATDRGLRIEYKLADEILGAFKSQLYILEIPRENIVRIDFKNGWFSRRLSVVVDSIELMNNFPNSESGRIQVKIKRDDHLLAEQFVDAMNLNQESDRKANSAVSSNPESFKMDLKILLSLMGSMNILGFVIFLLEKYEAINPAAPGVIRVASWLFGIALLGAVQSVLAVSYLVTEKRWIVKPALISMILPISPLFVVGIPFAIWAWPRPTKTTRNHSNVLPSQKLSLGKTTLFREPEPLDPITGTFLLSFGIINVLLLALLWTQSSYELMNRSAFILPSLVGGALVAATQILSVVLSKVTGKRSLTKSAIIASVLPISPLVVIGIPFAIWAWMRRSKTTGSHSNVLPSHKPSRGATTLMWLRERRVAKMFSVLDTLGACLVIGCMSVYFFGLFPTRIEYRLLIVSDMEKKAKGEMQQVSRDAIRARLAGMETVTDSKADSMPSIRAWAFQREEIMSRLQMTRAPRLYILVPFDWSAPDSVASYALPIAKDLRDAENAVERAPLGKVVRCVAVPDGLASDRVRSITTLHANDSGSSTTQPNLLVVEWSQQGRKEIENILTKGKTDAKTKFGIEIDGTVIAVSELQWLDGSSTSFELSAASRLNVDSIIAAVRGPDIPCELECLSR